VSKSIEARRSIEKDWSLSTGFASETLSRQQSVHRYQRSADVRPWNNRYQWQFSIDSHVRSVAYLRSTRQCNWTRLVQYGFKSSATAKRSEAMAGTRVSSRRSLGNGQSAGRNNQSENQCSEALSSPKTQGCSRRRSPSPERRFLAADARLGLHSNKSEKLTLTRGWISGKGRWIDAGMTNIER
jgi:hypothetical protein